MLLEKSIHSRIEKDEQYDELAALFKTLADETRLRIMFAISEKELCVQELKVALNVSSLVSHQMKTLKSMKLVKQRQEGKMYTILLTMNMYCKFLRLL